MMSTHPAFPLAAAHIATNSCPLDLRPPPGLEQEAAVRGCSRTLRRRRLRALHRERSNALVHRLPLELQRAEEALQRATREMQVVEAIAQAALYHADEERILATQQAEEQCCKIVGLEARLPAIATMEAITRSQAAALDVAKQQAEEQCAKIAGLEAMEATARSQAQGALFNGGNRNPIDVIYDVLVDTGSKRQRVSLKQGAAALREVGKLNESVANAALSEMEQVGIIRYDAKRRRVRLQV
mmetsp:Transcript_6333/g.11755  ORF Transcript_6333/g.11755 Transcript_6333/m.11755 type:complete len:242 (-) Transcript_6333:40-765(-)|eukprot:CAMPEP_0172902048 /NCGR_PEP_ID=MMETSP1075-20121228/167612_1 /TAXON_ID=2916 /ORGANISM="Ceratium fusus, Strain PA161109" /LENGTH=241 /DNA_ID=CAMNT_0013758571 /DNA_START=55 /DNA_END=780 /DNA_ORIENTATION=-